MINFALMKSGSSKLVYVGHSMGTTALFIMMNLHPEMESRIYSAHLLAPGNNITMEHENNNAISELMLPMIITNYFILIIIFFMPCSCRSFGGSWHSKSFYAHYISIPDVRIRSCWNLYSHFSQAYQRI